MNVTFECQKCGTCCTREGFVIWYSDEIQDLVKALGMSIEDIMIKYRISMGRHPVRGVTYRTRIGSCPFVSEDGTCSVYEGRPWQCRAYPYWPEYTKNPEAWEEEAKSCPGMKVEKCNT